VAPLIATYPLMTVGLSAIVLTNVRLTPRLVAAVALAVGGVILVLAG
jgi:drug/metabolite transporter (DMT)-like permease